MPARVEEVKHAEEEGIIFKFLTNPVRYLGTEDGWIRGVECQQMELGEPDESGRRRPVPVKGSEFVIECDVAIPAIGTRANPLLTSTTPDLKTNKWGYIEVDENAPRALGLRGRRHHPRLRDRDSAMGDTRKRPPIDQYLAGKTPRTAKR